MITGIGVDLIELDRIEQIINRNPRFVEKILTEKEMIIYEQKKSKLKRIEFLAGRFAGKEAFSKAFGTGIGKVAFQDIEILTGPKGEPRLHFNQPHQMNLHISISHSMSHAIAQVIIES